MEGINIKFRIFNSFNFLKSKNEIMNGIKIKYLNKLYSKIL